MFQVGTLDNFIIPNMPLPFRFKKPRFSYWIEHVAFQIFQPFSEMENHVDQVSQTTSSNLGRYVVIGSLATKIHWPFVTDDVTTERSACSGNTLFLYLFLGKAEILTDVQVQPKWPLYYSPCIVGVLLLSMVGENGPWKLDLAAVFTCNWTWTMQIELT